MTGEEIAQLFAPHIQERRQRFKEGMRLVHYTSAEAAYRIICNREVWLRNASMMNDFSEIQHGILCLSQAWASPAGARLQQMLDRLKMGLRDEVAELFDGHADGLRNGTYITSLSEHDDGEDEFGRLSMWRAYGGRAGVAIVMNNTAFAAETDEMKVYSVPVFYQDADTFTAWFQSWADNIVAAEEGLQELGAEGVRNVMFTTFRSFALCTKHPGFAEEREWRVFYSPMFEGESAWIEWATEVVHGVPQPLMKLKLFDDGGRGISGVHPSTLVNRVIIGPCAHPIQVRAGLASALAQAEVPDPMSKLWMSFIPLRHD